MHCYCLSTLVAVRSPTSLEILQLCGLKWSVIVLPVILEVVKVGIDGFDMRVSQEGGASTETKQTVCHSSLHA